MVCAFNRSTLIGLQFLNSIELRLVLSPFGRLFSVVNYCQSVFLENWKWKKFFNFVFIRYVHGECDKGCALNDDRYACPQCRDRPGPQQYADSLSKIVSDE